MAKGTLVKKITNIMGSMRFQIFAAIVAVGLVLSLVPSLIISGQVKSRYIGTRAAEIRNYVAKLSTRLEDNIYLQGGLVNNFDKELSYIAGIYNGRVVVVDNALLVLYDSFGIEAGKTLISEEAFKALDGVSSVHRDFKNKIMEVTCPVNSAKDGSVIGFIVVNASIESFVSISDGVRNTLIIVLLILYFILVVFGLIDSAVLTRGFNKVSERLHYISRGHFDEKVEVKGSREMRGITEAFNELLTRLNQLDSSRQEFVANVSHELKTPLTSMKILSDSLLSQDDVDTDTYREFLTDISSEVDRENKIIKDLLDLVRLDQKAAELNVSPVNINDMLEQILHRLAGLSEEKNVELILESFRTVVAEVDEIKLSLALTNLIENGIKYNRDGGYVRVSLNSDHRYLYIRIEDTGIGIPFDKQSYVFDRFYRVDKARSRESGGTGLGLAITRQVINLHNGMIKLYSDEGEGATFTVRMPLAYTKVDSRKES